MFVEGIMALKNKVKLDATMVKKQMLEEYMRRQVSGMGTWINERAYAVGIEPKDLYDFLNESFCNPKGLPRATSPLGAIDEDIMYRHKGMAVYNYFDLDTLISYGRFLQRVQENMYMSSYGRTRNKITSRDISNSINMARDYMIKNSGTINSHFYNPNKPMVCNKDIYNRLAPSPTMTPANFKKRYNESVCEDALSEYLDFGLEHGKLIAFGDKKYEISSQENYYTLDGDPISYIRAGRRDGMVLGYLNLDNRPYYGDVYKIVDDEMVYVDTADGVEVLDKENAPKVKKFDKLYYKSPLQKATKITSKNPKQM